MISFPNGEALAEMLGGTEGGITIRFEPEMAHVFPVERRKEFNQWIEEIVRKGEDLNQRER